MRTPQHEKTRHPDPDTYSPRSRWLRLQAQTLKRQALQAAERGEVEAVFSVGVEVLRRR